MFTLITISFLIIILIIRFERGLDEKPTATAVFMASLQIYSPDRHLRHFSI